MNNTYRIPETDLYKIKVNKKDSYNNIHKNQNYIINSNNKIPNSSKLYHINTHIPSYNAIKNIPISKHFNINHNLTISPYPNNTYLANTKKIKFKNNSNSEEKIRKGNLTINYNDDQNQKEGNIFQDLINNKYLRPILDSKDIDEKLLNCNLKEPIRNSFNISLNDFFNRKRNMSNFKTPKNNMNKRGHGLSIKTHYNNNFFNNANNDIKMHNNRTIENNNSNSYNNDFQMTNNYYNNNEINLLNFQSYNNYMHFSSEGKKMKDYSYNDNNSLMYYSYERNNNNFGNSHKTYINSNISNIHYLNDENDFRENNYHYINKYNNANSPINNFFKSNTYTEKKTKSKIDNYLNYRPNKNNFKNKEINIRNIGNIFTLGQINRKYENNEYNKKNDNKYDEVKNKIKENNKNKNQNKYDYSKELFDIYRGKLINEFLKHIKKAIKKPIHKLFKNFIYLMRYRSLNKIEEIFIPKISLENINNDNKIRFRKSPNLKRQTYSKIFYSEKKFLPKNNFPKFSNIKTNIIPINLNQRNTENKKAKKVNNNILISKYEIKNNKIFNSNKKFKVKHNYSNKSSNNHLHLIKINRNSLFSNKTNKKLFNDNNIKIINISNLSTQYIYKKKVKLNKKNTFVSKKNKNLNLDDNKNNIDIKNKENHKDNILSNSKGKIIDIDINLGKPIKDISDINPLENIFINEYNNKKYKNSNSANKKDRSKRRQKSKNQKLSLPKKKYLEEDYDDEFPIRIEEDNIIYHRNNSYNGKNIKLKKNIKLNKSFNSKNNDNYSINFINKNNKNMNKIVKKNYKNILVKNIKTSDKRLFIHINYIVSFIQNNDKNVAKKYDINLLLIKREIFFSIIIQKDVKIIYINKGSSNNSFYTLANSRDYTDTFLEKKFEKMNKYNYIKNYQDKYLLSCLKLFIKDINKVFLNKAFAHFLSIIDNKYKKKTKVKKTNEYNINRYKKKISKEKV